jgi:hypothetical protein
LGAPPDPSTLRGQCVAFLKTLRAGRADRAKVTVATPDPDETISRIMTETDGKLSQVTISDAGLQRLAASYRAALVASSASVRTLARAMSAGATPSRAVQQRVRDNAQAEEDAQRALQTYCATYVERP